jgi:Ribonuclease G/E
MNDNALVDRLPRFRELAGEARQAAALATSVENKRAYEELAEAWEQLLKEIEQAT